MPSKANLQKIHIGKKELNLSDEIYRDILHQVTGKESSKDISDLQASKILERYKELGWKPKAGKKAKTRRPLADDAQSRKIRQLWLRLHEVGKITNSSEEALAAYVKRMVRVDALQWLTSDKASRVIEAMKKWLGR
jgi:phage gp16-like protein